MRYLFLLTLILTSMLIPRMSCGETFVENAAVPNTIWETTIQDPNFEYELKGSAISPDGSHISLILGSRPKGRSSGHQDIKLQTVDVEGKLQTGIELNAYLQPADAPESYVDVSGVGMAINAAGVVYLALTQTAGQIRYLGVDVKTGRILVNKMIEFNFPISFAYKMLITKSDTLLLLGSADKKGFMAEINKSGNILWQEKIDAPTNVILDAVEMKNGYAIVGGRVGNPPFLLFKEIWVGSVGTKGELLQSRALPGPASFTASIAQSSNGQFMVGYDRLDSTESEISQVVGQGLNRDFHPTWNKILSLPNKGSSQVSIKSVFSGGYIVAVVNRSFSVSRLQDDGTVSWSHSTKVIAPDYPMFNDVNLLRAGQDFVLVSGLSVVSNRTQRQIVKLAKFPIK